MKRNYNSVKLDAKKILGRCIEVYKTNAITNDDFCGGCCGECAVSNTILILFPELHKFYEEKIEENAK